MTRMLPRTKLHSSTFIRRLAELQMVDAADSGDAFAEKLGGWIHFADAIALSAVHGDGIAAARVAQPGTNSASRTESESANDELERVQNFLATLIRKNCTSTPGKTLTGLPAPPGELPLNVATAYVPYRRFYEAHQRDMDMSIRPLRASVRAAVAKASPALKKLAELDAMMEKILWERENKLLSQVPVLLKKRFEQLYKAHQHRLEESGQADNPAAWTKSGNWLAEFCNDMQGLLLAEMELRLQPATGLIEALKQDTQ